MTPDQKRRAEQITSLFENDTTELQYDYIENLNDGRGYTCGRDGFTTRDGDLLMVIQRYGFFIHAATILNFVPALKRLADRKSGLLTGLTGFATSWRVACKDWLMRTAQDDESDATYFQPAMKHCQEIGLKYATSQAAIYDAIIQHGDGDDGDSLGALIHRTAVGLGGTPKDETVSEINWIQGFLRVRRANLLNPYAEETRDVWRESVARVDAFKQILDQGNLDLHGPLTVLDYDEKKRVIQ